MDITGIEIHSSISNTDTLLIKKITGLKRSRLLIFPSQLKHAITYLLPTVLSWN